MSDLFLPLKEQTFERVLLPQADHNGRDVVFNGVLLAEYENDICQYQLYHTDSSNPAEQLVGTKSLRESRRVEAVIMSINETDTMMAFFTATALHTLFRQCHFPGFQCIGDVLDAKEHCS
ncbi:hypothetical protein MACH09_45780 [Vibrio sp. MACH09]|uniref:hypothetical protein n=1 Tax=Vibrio sp. MACH09 TaxID=3025122 RepID=UPI00278E31F1|nr:hypothetical protein [Vibrio sp. MACH09]GLO64070.1 hypothetical protein MACH09_45780 [Vibrio sp. MACH09]